MAEWERAPRLRGRGDPAAASRAPSTRATPTTRSGRCCTASPRASSSHPESWQAYRDANERFAEPSRRACARATYVWAHDYQLMLVPAPGARRGAGRAHRLLPAHPLPVVGGLPHPARARGAPARTPGRRLRSPSRPTPTCTTSGARCSRSWASSRRWTASRSGDRTVQLAALPIGIESDGWRRLTRPVARPRRDRRSCKQRTEGASSSSRSTGSTTRRASPSACARSAACSRARRQWRGRVTLVQVAVPSRERVPAYAELRREVARARRRGQRRVRYARVAARRVHPSLRSSERGAGGALRRGRRRLGRSAARRHEPRGQGVRGLPARSARASSS